MASQKLDLNSKDLVVRSLKTLKGSAAASESSKVRTRVLQNELVLQKIYGQITLQGQGIEDASAAAADAQADAAAAAAIANAAGKVWFQASAPTIGSRPNAINGDRWYDSDDGSLYEAIGGAWVLQTSDVPLDAAAYWPFDEVPEIPDNAAGTTYRSNFAAGVDGWTSSGATLSVEGGKLKIVTTSADAQIKKVFSEDIEGKTLRFRLSGEYSLDLVLVFYTDVTYTQIVPISCGNGLYDAIIPTSAKTVSYLRIDPAKASGKTCYLDVLYVGTAAYTTVAPDASGRGWHVGLYGPTPDGAGGLAFDGINDYGVSPACPIATEMTWFARVKLSVAQNEFIIDQRSASAVGCQPMYISSVGEIQFYDGVTGNLISSPGTIAFDVEEHTIICRGSASAREIWLDGTCVAVAATGITPQAGIPVTLGARFSLTSFLAGTILSAGLYTRWLSDTELLGLYKAKTLPKAYTLSRWITEQAASDAVITPGEKKGILTEWLRIYGNAGSGGSYSEAVADATAAGVSSSALTTAYNALYAYLYTTPGVLAASLWLSPIPVTRATYDGLWYAYEYQLWLLKTAITDAKKVAAAALAPKYLGRYNAGHPATRNNLDWWVVYDTDDSPVQRGVWYDNAGTAARITTASGATLLAKMPAAMGDIAWAEAQGTYGTASDYGIETFFESLGAVTAFISELFAQDITATGSITGAKIYSSDGHVKICDDASSDIFGEGICFANYDLRNAAVNDDAMRSSNVLFDYAGKSFSVWNETRMRQGGSWDTYPKVRTFEQINIASGYANISFNARGAGTKNTAITIYNGASTGYIDFDLASDAGSARVRLDEIAFYGRTDDSTDLGKASYRWKNAWATQFLSASTDVTSTSAATWFTPALGENGEINYNDGKDGGSASGKVYYSRDAGGTTVTLLAGDSGYVSVSGTAIQIKAASASYEMEYRRIILCAGEND